MAYNNSKYPQKRSADRVRENVSAIQRQAKPIGKLRYVIFYKPYGVLSQFTPDQPGQRTLAEFGLPEGLYAAGRLDADSEGLLLLTNDGDLIHTLLQPGTGHDRTYLVQIEEIPTPEALAELEKGVRIQDYTTLPAKATLLEKEPQVPERVPPIRKRLSIPTSWIELTLKEGKNRQVRKMTAAVGHPTLRLLRIALGKISLKGIEEGKFRDLSKEEVVTLKHLDITKKQVSPKKQLTQMTQLTQSKEPAPPSKAFELKKKRPRE